jgi:hypothetical protein
LLLSENYKKSKGFKKLIHEEREREMWCEVVDVKYSIYKEELIA